MQVHSAYLARIWSSLFHGKQVDNITTHSRQTFTMSLYTQTVVSTQVCKVVREKVTIFSHPKKTHFQFPARNGLNTAQLVSILVYKVEALNTEPH